ncbi:MAG: radical SAM protein [Catonella sp.]|nr:radical SAM protein [Catonella sp.]MDY6355647.1 radical SAM protein [Catonella sp.]
MYNKTIGDLLYYYRNQKKISEEELCSGICSVSTYSRYESDETTTDKFTYGYFFERMGVDFDTINYLSSPSEGKIENERNKIYCCLKEKNYEGTKALLEEYVKKHGKKKIHKQYAMLVKGWLSELKGDKEKAQVSYAAGIACTNIDIHNINKLYSSIECELLLCYIRCTHNTDYLSKLLTFLQGKDEYDCIRAHFQTKASLQYIKGLENIDKKIKIINETEDYLKNIKRITGLNRLLKEKKALADMAKLDDDEQVILDNIDLLFQIRDIEPNNKATYTESDLIRNLRKETNLTQIQLSNDICDTTLLARYEEGKVDPGKGKYRQLMNKMGRDGQNYTLTYATGKFQDIKQYYKIEKMFENNENDRALQEMFYNDIESNFVTNDLEKSQMISRIKLLKEKYAKKLSVNQYIGKLEKLLSRSIQEYQKGEFSILLFISCVMTIRLKGSYSMLHYFEKDGENVLISGKYLTVNHIDKKTGEYINNLSYEENQKLEDQIAKNKRYNTPKRALRSKRNCEKLSLVVTDKCNMTCKYCYEKEFDSYNHGFMSEETMKNAVDFFYKRYPEGISIIHFFGGEPLMNFELVENSVIYIHNKSQNEGYCAPKFVMSTNGTLLNDENIDFLEGYFESITISLDGVKNVNDSNRRFKGNEEVSVYDRVIDRIKYINERKDKLKIGLETTFTRQNYLYLKENNISARKYVDFLYSLGTDMVAIKPVISFDGGEEYSLENENESKLFEFIDEMHSEILRRNNNLYSSNIINNILNQKYKDYYCSAGTNSFSVSTSGDIYPCFMFDGKRQFKMGNVNEKTDDNKFTATKDKIQSLSKTTNGNCKDCWANKLCDSTCAGCIGSFELYNQDIKKPIDFNCKVGKTMIERSVVEMIETIKNFQSASCEA